VVAHGEHKKAAARSQISHSLHTLNREENVVFLLGGESEAGW
jgi:hypothetical protein